MATTCSIDGMKLEPCPLVTISKSYNRTDDGLTLSANYTITLNLTLISNMGSPRSKLDATLSSTGWASAPVAGGPTYFYTLSGYAPTETISSTQRLAAIERKQEAIRLLFMNKADRDANLLEIQSESGDQPIKATVKLQELTFSEGIWVNTCQCTIVLLSHRLSVNGVSFDADRFDSTPWMVESFNETWGIETDDAVPESDTRPRTYRLSHSMEAKGQVQYDKTTGSLLNPAWESAKNYIYLYWGNRFQHPISLAFPNYTANTGIYAIYSNNVTSSGVRDLPNYYNAYNFIRTENIGKSAGTYGITESWILASGNSFEDYSIEKSDDANNGVISVNVNGTITGLDERDPIDMSLVNSKFVNADTRWSGTIGNLHNRAQIYGQVTLNPLALSKTVGKNRTTGVITYNYGFDTRPTTLVPGARSEQITITYPNQADVFAMIPVLGRTVGPVLQSLGTKQPKKKTLNISAVILASGLSSMTPPSVSAIETLVIPTGSQVYVESVEENLSTNGNYQFTKTWVYEV